MRYGLFVLFAFSWVCGFAQDGEATIPGQVAPELIGKWCLLNPAATTSEAMTNSCITLNADGSYEIHLDRTGSVNASTFGSNIQESDYGNWWVQEDRIYYISSSQGKGSFRLQKMNHPRLENRATILLDGIVFCAAFVRDPW